MFTIQGVCDWCKQNALVTRHNYIDGKCHHACEVCNERAKLDVHHFNQEELEISNKHSRHHAA